MKKITLVFAALVMIITSCNKQAEQRSASTVETITTKAPVKMTVAEFKTATGIDFIKAWEQATASGVAMKKAKPQNATLLTVTEDLTISGSVSCTTSPNAEWGAIQKFLALPLSNDGAVSYCNFNWSYTAPAPSMDCPTSETGVYRGFTSDHDYNVHLSPPLSL
jgi:hypothetical protein